MAQLVHVNQTQLISFISNVVKRRWVRFIVANLWCMYAGISCVFVFSFFGFVVNVQCVCIVDWRNQCLQGGNSTHIPIPPKTIDSFSWTDATDVILSHITCLTAFNMTLNNEKFSTIYVFRINYSAYALHCTVSHSRLNHWTNEQRIEHTQQKKYGWIYLSWSLCMFHRKKNTHTNNSNYTSAVTLP